MTKPQATGKPRQRAPSKRALATRTRVLDAAEKVFTDRGFDGATIRMIFDLAVQEPRWRNYARLVAFVSVDDRWRALSAECFDPTAEVFLAEIKHLAPHATPQQTAEAFVFTVAAMLALLTSQGRISDLAGGSPAPPARIDHLVAFCAAGFTA